MMESSSSSAAGAGVGGLSLSRGQVLAVVFLAMLALQLVLHWRSALYDTDSYVHLAMGRLYAEQGVPTDLEGARYSVMHQGFGDKEWLFHALLAPLILVFEPLVAGRVALALLNSLMAIIIAAWARTALGAWGLLVPFLMPLASTEFFWRTVRLRPELLALSLMLCALLCLADRRPRLLGLCMLLFTWSYTAFHALLGVLLLSWVALELNKKRSRVDALAGEPGQGRNQGGVLGWRTYDWPLAVYPVLGAGAGLVLHPHFPHNLVVWLVQNVQFFFAKGGLDAGSEIHPNTTDVVLLANLCFWLLLLVIWRCSRPENIGVRQVMGDGAELARKQSNAWQRLIARRTIVLGVAATTFTLLYLLMSRFSIYSMPLLALWLMYEVRRQRKRPSRWVSLPFGWRLKTAWVVVICLGIGVPGAARQIGTYLQRTELGPDDARRTEWQALSAAIPSGAQVAADWRSTGVLMLFAPQGRYLNVLDPVFMATPHPGPHRQLRSILDGSEPDVPAAVFESLDSDYLLIRTVGANPRLVDRLRNDPRSEIVFQGSYLLAKFRPAPGVFLSSGWRGTAGTTARPQTSAQRRFEGFLSGGDFAFEGPCMSVENTVETGTDGAVRLDLAAQGPTSLWFDGQPLVSQNPGVHAVLGRGVQIALHPTAGTHRIAVQTCRSDLGGEPGFYLRVN